MDMFKCALHQVLRNYTLYLNPPANLPCGRKPECLEKNTRLSAERWHTLSHEKFEESWWRIEPTSQRWKALVLTTAPPKPRVRLSRVEEFNKFHPHKRGGAYLERERGGGLFERIRYTRSPICVFKIWDANTVITVYETTSRATQGNKSVTHSSLGPRRLAQPLCQENKLVERSHFLMLRGPTGRLLYCAVITPKLILISTHLKCLWITEYIITRVQHKWKNSNTARQFHDRRPVVYWDLSNHRWTTDLKLFLRGPSRLSSLVRVEARCGTRGPGTAVLDNDSYYIHKRRKWGMLRSDWFVTRQILAHLCRVEKVNKMSATFWAFQWRWNSSFPLKIARKNTLKKQ